MFGESCKPSNYCYIPNIKVQLVNSIDVLCTWAGDHVLTKKEFCSLKFDTTEEVAWIGRYGSQIVDNSGYLCPLCELSFLCRNILNNLKMYQKFLRQILKCFSLFLF